MQRVIFVNRFYAPDHSATSQILTDLAEHLALSDKKIHIVTSRQLYENAKAQLQSIDLINSVIIHRVFSTKFGRKNIICRSIDYISFYIFSFIFLLRFVEAEDIIVAKTDPPLISVIAAIVTKVKKAKLVNWIQDLFPEIVNAINPGAIPFPLFVLLQKIRNWSLTAAEYNIVIGELMRGKLNELGIDNSKIRVIQNWHVGNCEIVSESEINSLKKLWGLNNKYVVEYSGNLGRAHDYLTFAKTIEALKERQDIVFLFIGGGIGMDSLKKYAQEKNLQNIVFQSYQSMEGLNLSLSVADLHLVSLLPELEGLIVPSKFYGIMAVGRPLIFVGSLEGELAIKINKYELGCSMTVGEANMLAKKIEQIIDMGGTYNASVKNIYNQNYLSKYNYDKWIELINK